MPELSDSSPSHDATVGGMERLIAREPWEAWRVAGLYAILATLWIVFSDRALPLLFPDFDAAVRWSSYKGLAFVGLTSVLLLLLMRRSFAVIRAAQSDLQAHQAEMERVNRLYAARSQIGLAIVRQRQREALFRQVCEVLVAHGFKAARIGWQAGDADRWEVRVSVGALPASAADLPPFGEAAAVAHPRISNDLRREPAMQAWRETIDRADFGSAAFLPLHQDDAACGSLQVFAAPTGFFGVDEVALLEEVALDVSFALDSISRREGRERAEARAHSEQRFSSAIMQSVPGILYFYDEDGRFLRWNQNLETVSGYSGAEISRMSPGALFPPDARDAVAERIAEVFSLGESSIEAPFLSRDGRTTPYFLTGRRTDFDGKACLVGIGIDISERKRMEIELRELNQTLELQVEERTAQLESALERAEAADRTKSAFLATMSHELRTPLNSIIGFTGILLQGLAGALNPEQTKQMGMVQSSARHLLELINDVLDLSRIEAGQLEVRFEPFDLKVLLDRVLETVRPLARHKGLELRGEFAPVLPDLSSDRRRVEQILLNLLNNAIKFTDQGSVILSAETASAFPAHATPLPGPAIRLSVIDTGCGIHATDLPKLFQPFSQIDSGLTRQHEGTGLGLAICRRLCDLLDATIDVKSTSHHGSTFTVTFPLKPSRHGEPDNPAD